MKNRLIVRLFVILLAAIMVFNAAACDGCSDGKINQIGNDVLTIWADSSMGRTTRHDLSVDTTQKVMVLESAKNE